MSFRRLARGSACDYYVSLDREFLVGIELFIIFMVGGVKICDNLIRLAADLELITALFKVYPLLVFWTCMGSQAGDGSAARQALSYRYVYWNLTPTAVTRCVYLVKGNLMLSPAIVLVYYICYIIDKKLLKNALGVSWAQERGGKN